MIPSPVDRMVCRGFVGLLTQRLPDVEVTLFGSRARGDAEVHSDLDLLVILPDGAADDDRDYVSECAWEAGFEHGIVVVPVVFTRQEWERGPERESLLAKAVAKEGVPL